jgi:acyl-CoA dehydrogenase
MDTATPGFRVGKKEKKMGLRGSDTVEVVFEDCLVPHENMLGPQGQGHTLGQVRLGPARLAHCMRWIGQIEKALDMMVARTEERMLHGARLSEKQGIQWKISEAALALYQCKLMVLHSAYLIEAKLPFRQEVSMTKFFVANTLWKVVDAAIQVHGALGYSWDTPLEQMLKSALARLVDGADEVHLTQIAKTTDAFRGGLDAARDGLGLLF